MRSPHTIEVQFVFNNIKIAGPLISKMPEAYALAEKVDKATIEVSWWGKRETVQVPLNLDLGVGF